MSVSTTTWRAVRSLPFLVLAACGAASPAPATVAVVAEAPVSPPSPPAPTDDGRVPIAWRVDAPAVFDLRAAGSWAAIDASDGIHVIDPVSGAELTLLASVPRTSGFDDEPRMAIADHTLIADSAPRLIQAYDLSQAASPSWQLACANPSLASCRVLATVVEGSIVVASGRTRDLIALDPMTGTTRWTRSVDFGFHGPLASAGSVLYAAGEQHRMHAIDAATGATRWTAECDPAFAASSSIGRGPSDCRRIVANERNVAAIAVSGSEIVLLDPVSGAERARISLSHVHSMSGIDLVLHEGLLTIVGIAGEEGAIVQLDAATGALRWQVRTGEPVMAVVDDGESIWARGNAGALWRVDRSGAVTRRWGFASGRRVVAWRDAILIDVGDGVLALDPRRALEPDPELHVAGHASIDPEHGTTRTQVRVRVGDQIIDTAPDGSFDFRVRARGGVRVSVVGDPVSPCDRVADAFASDTDPEGATTLSVHRGERRCLER